MNTIESLQRWLKAKGFDPGPIDGVDGPLTFAGWSAYLASTGASNTTDGLLGSQDALKKLLARAQADIGVLSTSEDAGTDHGELGCADAVTRILHDELGFSLPKTLSTDELYDELVSGGWNKVDLRTPGAVIVSPSCAAMHGHTGIVGEDGAIYSNSSATGLWSQNWTVMPLLRHRRRLVHAWNLGSRRSVLQHSGPERLSEDNSTLAAFRCSLCV
jgi:hypothetical protein